MDFDDLVKDIKCFWNIRRERVLTERSFLQIENELDAKIAKFKNILPSEYHGQFNELEEICYTKRCQSNVLFYQRGFAEGVKTFLFTVCFK